MVGVKAYWGLPPSSCHLFRKLEKASFLAFFLPVAWLADCLQLDSHWQDILCTFLFMTHRNFLSERVQSPPSPLRACNMTSQIRQCPRHLQNGNVCLCPTEQLGGKSPEWGLGGRGKTFYVRIISNNHLWILSAEQTQQCLHKSKSLLSCSSSSSTLLSAFTSFVLLCDTVSCSAFIRFSSFFLFFCRCQLGSDYSTHEPWIV